MIFEAKERFKLSEKFLESYKGRQPEWGPLGLLTYKRSYSRNVDGENRTEEFWETLKRVVEGCYTIQLNHCRNLKLPWNQYKSQKSAQEMFRLMWEFKFLPPGRGLWAMGTDVVWKKGSASLLNCFHGDTQFYVKEDNKVFLKSLKDCVDTTVNVCNINGEWTPAEVKCFGKQKLIDVIFKSVRGGEINDYRFDYLVTENHKWILSDGTETTNIKVGDRIKSRFYKFDMENDEYEKGWDYAERYFCSIDLYKNKYEQVFDPDLDDCSLSYQKGFFDCWKKYDAYLYTYKNGTFSLRTTSIKLLRWILNVAPLLGYSISSVYEKMSRYVKQPTVIKPTTFFKISLVEKEIEYSVENILEDDTDPMDVYCVVEPKTHSFMIEKGIITGNCAFTSTKDIDYNFSEPFEWLMDMSMFGVGVAFDTLGAGKVMIQEPKLGALVHVVDDSKEGWCEAVRVVLDSYAGVGKMPKEFDFSKIRKAGEIIKTFGGIAPGPDPLIRCINEVTTVLDRKIGQLLSSVDIVDLMNIIGKCVVSGGIRRCLPENTIVHTNHGLIKIKDVIIGDEVKTTAGYRRVLENVYQGKQKLFKITTELGDFICTPQHRMKVFKSENILEQEFKRAYDITTNDKLVFYVELTGCLPVSILSTEYLDIEDETYDLSVEDNHEFICDIGYVSHNTAELALGSANDLEYIDRKNGETYEEELKQYRWASNDSVLVEKGMNYKELSKRVFANGEPGFVNLELMRKYGRMKDGINNKDEKVAGVNPSLRKGTKVHTTNGIFNIEDLQDKEFEVINIDGNISPAKCFLSGKNKQLYKVSLSGGHEYYCTAEHKWPVYKHNQSKNNIKISKSWEKIETKDLLQKDCIVVSNVNLLYNSINGTRDEGFIIGWNLGDGWITDRKDDGTRQIGFIVSENDNKYGVGEKVKKILLEIGVDTKFTGCGEITVNNTKLLNIFNKFGVTKKEEGLPKEVWNNTSEEFRKGLIDGLFSSDGYIDTYGYSSVGISSSKKQLLYDISELLGFYGIKSTIRKQITSSSKSQFPNGKDYNRNYTQYILDISDNMSIVHFKEVFGDLTHTDKKRKLEEGVKNRLENRIMKPVNNRIKIEKVEPTDLYEDVWDITVYDDKHCFRLAHCVTGNCGEMSLEDHECCNIVETFPTKHTTIEEYIHTLKYAYLYAKTVTLVSTHCERTNQVMLRNRRIGVSICGIIDAFEKFGRREFISWMDRGYDRIKQLDKKYSDWLCIPESIKMCAVKPAGSVSLLAGTSPGIHYPHSEYYIRRIRIQNGSPLIKRLNKANIPNEPTVYNDNTVVFSFPVKTENYKKGKNDVTIWEQVENAVIVQHYWSDNCISQTVTVKESEKDEIASVLELFEDRLKTISFLPLVDHKYEQAPYEEITKEQYEEMVKAIKPLNLSGIPIKEEDSTREKFCTNDTCELVFPGKSEEKKVE